MSLHGKAGAVGVSGKFRVGGSGGKRNAGNTTQRVESVRDDLRCAVFAVPELVGSRPKVHEVGCFESDLLAAQIVERAHEQTGAAEQQNAERDLHADSDLAEALRALGRGACVLAQCLGQVGAQEVKDGRDAEQQAGDKTKWRA